MSDKTQTNEKINVGSTGPVTDSKHLPDANGDAKNDAKVADAHKAALESQKSSSTAVENDKAYTVSAGVPTGAVPAEAIFTPSDKVLVEKEGAWCEATIVNVTPIGVPDQLTGEKVKYTVAYCAVNGVSASNPEQYVPQSRVKALSKAEQKVSDDGGHVASSDASDVHKAVEVRAKASRLAEGRYPTAEHLKEAATAGDSTEPGSPANNADLNGAIDDNSKAEVDNFDGDKKEQSPNTVVNPGGSVSVDSNPENQVRVAASDTTAEGATNPSAVTSHDTLDEAGLKAKQAKEAKAHEKEVAKEKKSEKKD